MAQGTGTPFFDSGQSGVGRAAVVGTVVAGFIVGGLAVAICLYAGAGLGESLAIAAFAAFFGGPGFGAMLGVVVFLSRQQDAARTAPPNATVGQIREERSAEIGSASDRVHDATVDDEQPVSTSLRSVSPTPAPPVEHSNVLQA
jgi:hypothetical protein